MANMSFGELYYKLVMKYSTLAGHKLLVLSMEYQKKIGTWYIKNFSYFHGMYEA